MRKIRVALLGAGNVGSQFVDLLYQKLHFFEKIGVKIELLPVLVHDLSKNRGQLSSEVKFADNFDQIGEFDALIELIGGENEPLKFILDALRSKKIVITANKSLLTNHWAELKPFAESGLLFYEASVLAGTPIIGALSSFLQVSRVCELTALLSSTCNFVLSEMEKGISYEDAVFTAQKRGIAETPPILDVSGLDSAHKLTILARLTIDPDFSLDNVEIEGIENVKTEDFQKALSKNMRLRLLASLKPKKDGWQAKVAPTLIEKDTFLAKAERNALVFVGDPCGELIFIGNTGGPRVTASAVLGDLFCALQGQSGHRPRRDFAMPSLC